MTVTGPSQVIRVTVKRKTIFRTTIMHMRNGRSYQLKILIFARRTRAKNPQANISKTNATFLIQKNYSTSNERNAFAKL